MLGMTFWVTSKCNMKCTYCYEKNEKEHYVMSKDIANCCIKFLLDRIKQNKEKEIYIRFHGGEPLLEYPIIYYMVNKIKELSKLHGFKLSFGITTNGTLLDEERIGFLCSNINDLSISLDGMKDTNDLNRRYKNNQGTFEDVIKHLDSILKKDVNLRVRMTVTPQTKDKLCDNVMYFIHKGVKTISPSIDFFDKSWTEEDLEVLSEELKKIVNYLVQLPNQEEIKVGMIIDENTIITKKGICNGGRDTFHVYSNGDLYPCSLTVPIKEFKIGNIYEGLLEEKVQEIICISKNKIEICIGCPNYDYCINTRCKIINKLFTNDYYKPLPLKCNMEHIQYEVLQYLRSLK